MRPAYTATVALTNKDAKAEEKEVQIREQAQKIDRLQQALGLWRSIASSSGLQGAQRPRHSGDAHAPILLRLKHDDPTSSPQGRGLEKEDFGRTRRVAVELWEETGPSERHFEERAMWRTDTDRIKAAVHAGDSVLEGLRWGGGSFLPTVNSSGLFDDDSASVAGPFAARGGGEIQVARGLGAGTGSEQCVVRGGLAEGQGADSGPGEADDVSCRVQDGGRESGRLASRESLAALDLDSLQVLHAKLLNGLSALR